MVWFSYKGMIFIQLFFGKFLELAFELAFDENKRLMKAFKKGSSLQIATTMAFAGRGIEKSMHSLCPIDKANKGLIVNMTMSSGFVMQYASSLSISWYITDL